MVGATLNDRVMLIASSELTEVELQVVYEENFAPIWQERAYEPPNRTVALTASMRRYVIVYGATYAEALRKLFEHWDPADRSSQPALPMQPGLPSGG